MRYRRAIVTAAALGMMLGVSPAGSPVSADHCLSAYTIQLFFYAGYVVDGTFVGVPVTGDYGFAACVVFDGTGQSLDGNYVVPGLLAVQGRDNAATASNVQGSVVGLGVNAHEEWVRPASATVGTGGASSPTYALDPTATGYITGSTQHGFQTYKTLDNLS